MFALLLYMIVWETVTDTIDNLHSRCSKVFRHILNVSLDGANFKYGVH